MDTILHKISHSNKMPVLFIGSGISKRYLWKYPNWNELLKLSFSQFCKDDFQFQKYVDTFKRQGFSDFEINTALGTVIEKEYNNQKVMCYEINYVSGGFVTIPISETLVG